MSEPTFIYHRAGNGDSSGTTPVTIITITSTNFASDMTINLIAQITGKDRINNLGGGYVLSATFKWNGTTLTQVGTTTVISSHEDDADWNATISVSGTNIIIQGVGGAGQEVAWGAKVQTVAGISAA